MCVPFQAEFAPTKPRPNKKSRGSGDDQKRNGLLPIHARKIIQPCRFAITKSVLEALEKLPRFKKVVASEPPLSVASNPLTQDGFLWPIKPSDGAFGFALPHVTPVRAAVNCHKSLKDTFDGHQCTCVPPAMNLGVSVSVGNDSASRMSACWNLLPNFQAYATSGKAMVEVEKACAQRILAFASGLGAIAS